MAIATCVAICAASFLLGSLFTSELWDSAVLFSSKGPVTEEIIGFVENYYHTWWEGAMAVKMTLHLVIVVLFLALVFKFARYTDTTFFFSGGSLLLLVLVMALYITITLPSLRLLSAFPLVPRAAGSGRDLFSKIQHWMSVGNQGPLGDVARANAEKEALLSGLDYADRVETISVLAAANTIAMVLLIGIIILQIGEWYVEETVVKEAYGGVLPVPVPKRGMNPAAVVTAPVTAEKKAQ